VVNLSLGHHFGAHDGTDSEERLHAQITGPGRIVVVSAGNEQNDDIHIGGRRVARVAGGADWRTVRSCGGGLCKAVVTCEPRIP
jgi:hypothetical protein